MTPKVERHDIEAPIQGKRLGIGFLERDGQALGVSTFAPTLKQRAHVVRRYDVGETAGGGERRIAVAGGDVEDTLVAAKIDGLAQHLADNLQRGADHRVVAAAPGGLLSALDRGEINRRRGDCLHVHRCTPSFGLMGRGRSAVISLELQARPIAKRVAQ
jgi:hypothetical protein